MKDPEDRYTAKAIRELLKPRGGPDGRLRTSRLPDPDFQEAMKILSEDAVDYQLVESILVEVGRVFLAC